MSSRVAQSCQGHRDITRLPKGCLLCPPPPCPLHSCCPGCFPDLFSGLWNSVLCPLPWRHRGHQSSLEKKDVSEPDSGHTASVPGTELLHWPVNSRHSVHVVCHPSCSQMTLHLLEILPSSRTSWPWSGPPMSPPPLLNPGAAGKSWCLCYLHPRTHPRFLGSRGFSGRFVLHGFAFGGVSFQ